MRIFAKFSFEIFEKLYQILCETRIYLFLFFHNFSKENLRSLER